MDFAAKQATTWPFALPCLARGRVWIRAEQSLYDLRDGVVLAESSTFPCSLPVALSFFVLLLARKTTTIPCGVDDYLSGIGRQGGVCEGPLIFIFFCFFRVRGGPQMHAYIPSYYYMLARRWCIWHCVGVVTLTHSPTRCMCRSERFGRYPFFFVQGYSAVLELPFLLFADSLYPCCSSSSPPITNTAVLYHLCIRSDNDDRDGSNSNKKW